MEAQSRLRELQSPGASELQQESVFPGFVSRARFQIWEKNSIQPLYHDLRFIESVFRNPDFSRKIDLFTSLGKTNCSAGWMSAKKKQYWPRKFSEEQIKIQQLRELAHKRQQIRPSSFRLKVLDLWGHTKGESWRRKWLRNEGYVPTLGRADTVWKKPYNQVHKTFIIFVSQKTSMITSYFKQANINSN